MKHITVSVDERTHRMAHIRAAALDTSVSALVRQYLRDFVSGDVTVPANRAAEAATEVEEPGTDRHRRMAADVSARTVSIPELMNRRRLSGCEFACTKSWTRFGQPIPGSRQWTISVATTSTIVAGQGSKPQDSLQTPRTTRETSSRDTVC